ncbi:threonylcarbamoyl-AMP synthase [Candidatus Woesebacteria bacterium RIFCSPHIGHO2_01_FULL_38_9]|uniref:L-threonylcarbamoyladenylate synthase n=2 Tax=Candidatus Woeseibacteriota TaxID=1752722 RepID=A0A1F7Y0N3_9BACT|nr:MAG: threonylcarbamoyl-AMP synthase [Candidatus Woesebacteria bacterium RIFCSPHIGHO2_01_FULL_38_9]OGM59141.1 MAG: threonylcarbamoyl-AMP synthase [Candidatus Woesebacteria bacterium RIFCSPLOWO2_01_FULL_39_10]
MVIKTVYLKRINTKVLRKAADILKSGGLVVYPTDTTYGLGANALDEKAVRKIYELKGREFSKPTHVIVRDWKMIEKLTYVNDAARKLFEEFLPGPLTIILRKKKIVPDILTADLPTLGIRIPKTKITQSLSNLLPFPYTTPSANRSGGKTPYSIDEVKVELDIDKIDLILDAGPLPQVKPSTIIDLSSSTPKILRQGPVTKKEIEKVLKVKIVS